MSSFAATLTLIGGPTVLIELAGLRFVTDPTFDGPGFYPGAVTLEKLTAPALSADEVGAVDAVLLSHDQHPSPGAFRSGPLRSTMTALASASGLIQFRIMPENSRLVERNPAI
jgi:hypothetical protein